MNLVHALSVALAEVFLNVPNVPMRGGRLILINEPARPLQSTAGSIQGANHAVKYQIHSLTSEGLAPKGSKAAREPLLLLRASHDLSPATVVLHC